MAVVEEEDGDDGGGGGRVRNKLVFTHYGIFVSSIPNFKRVAWRK